MWMICSTATFPFKWSKFEFPFQQYTWEKTTWLKARGVMWKNLPSLDIRTDWVIIITLLFTLVANLLYILVSWVSKAATASAPQTEYLLATNFFQKTNPEHHNNVNFNMIFALTICLDNTSKCPKSSIFLRLMLFKEDFADFQGFLNTKILFLLKASVMGSQSVNYELN